MMYRLLVKKAHGLFIIFFILILLLAFDTCSAKHHDNEDKTFARNYFVELDENNPFAVEAFTNYIAAHHLENDIHIHRTISHQFLNAVSFEIHSEEKEYTILKTLSDNNKKLVASISPIKAIKRAEYITPSMEVVMAKKLQNLTSEQVNLLSPHRLSQVDKVHNELNLDGEGLFVGVIDSGVDYYHIALGGGFGEGFKVVAGYDLVGSHWNSSDPNSKLKPDDDPLDDCGKDSQATGHGTHVSGIIAGFDRSNNFTGVAPGAKLGMWRVFSCTGSARSDVVIHAMLMAYDAGVDIISMSLGSTLPWSAPNDIQSKVVSKISANGVSVVISAGNDGEMGAFTTGIPGNVVSAFSVASVNNEYISYDGSLTATGIKDPIGFNFVNGTNLTMIDGILAPSYSGNGDPTSDACTADSVSKDISGKVVLIKRGVCTFSVKVANIAAAAGIGAIIYDNINEPTESILVTNATIPVVFISLQSGLKLVEAYKNNPNNTLVKFSSRDAGPDFLKSQYATTVSSFSSVGPTADLFLKPNIAAVGQLIYSTVPRYMGGWGIKQGTSMACPYFAGAIALYLQYHGINKTSRSVVHEKFQNYASVANVDNSTSGHLDNPLRQGAGLVQVYDTILQNTHVSPAQISFNDTYTADYKHQQLTITNGGPDDVSYRLFNNVSVSILPYNQSTTGYTYIQPSSSSFNSPTANIIFSLNEVYLKPNESQEIQITVQPPDTNPLDHIMYGGFIQLDPIPSSSQAKALHIPYFGIVGSQRDIPIIDQNFNMTVQNNATNITYGINDTIIYDFTASYVDEENKDEFMSLLINFKLESPTLVLKGEVLEDNQVLGYAFQPITYLERDFVNDTDHPSDPLIWNGEYFKNIPYDILGFSEENTPTIPKDKYVPVQNGNYSLRISALKQFGHLNNDEDWDSFTVGPIVVTRDEKEGNKNEG